MYSKRVQKSAQKWKFRFLTPTIITLALLIFAGFAGLAVQTHIFHAHAEQIEGDSGGGEAPVGDGSMGGSTSGSTSGNTTNSVSDFGLAREFVPGSTSNLTISAGNMMEEYTTINDANFQYNPTSGDMIEETTSAQGTTVQSIDPNQDAQTYNEVTTDLQGDPNSEPIDALNATVTTQNTVDLYRMGNATDPKLVTDPGGPGKVLPRVGVDIFPDENNMISPGQGGSSTFETMNKPAKWWKLPTDTQLPDGLQFRNDKPGHWLIEPSRTMTVDQFRQLLRQITGWIPVK